MENKNAPVGNRGDVIEYFVNYPKEFKINSKIIALDLDWTLIRPMNGRVHCKDKNDWEWLYDFDMMQNTLSKYISRKYSIIVITNQSREFKYQLIDDVAKVFNIPIAFLIGNKEIRKPDPILLEFLPEDFRKMLKPKKSIYVGDAAGRPGDWSDSDKEFAENCGFEFQTPEEFFEIQSSKDPQFKTRPSLGNTKFDDNDLVIMVGYPASGKTYYSERVLKERYGFTVFHKDDYKTEKQFINAAKKHLDKGLVLDATNANVEKRKKMMEQFPGKKYYVFHLMTDIDTAMANDSTRAVSAEGRDRLPKIAFYSYRKRYEEPTIEEGFERIYQVSIAE